MLFQLLPFKGKELNAYIPKEQKCFVNKTIEALVDLALDRINWKLLVLGNVFFTGDNGQIWTKEIDGKLKWQLIRHAAKKIAEQTKIDAFLISDIYENDLKEDDYLLKHSYRKFEVEPDLIFNINKEWDSFDDYLQSLSSKYRVRTNKVFSKAHELEIKSLSVEEIKKENKIAVFAIQKCNR
ncbi:MAG: hypothetical protein LRY27_02645 [Chitinophagales bacterium]|nr:hypothetical protein [Chitinophagales bacterium]